MSKLREHLFDQLDRLKNSTSDAEVQRAKAVCDVAQVIVNSAKVEVDFIKQAGGNHKSKFIDVEPIQIGSGLNKQTWVDEKGIPTTRHTMK